MPVVKKWTCDGCGAETETPLEADQCSFYQIKVTAGSWGGDFILCTKCHERLLGSIDPTKWPKYAVARVS